MQFACRDSDCNVGRGIGFELQIEFSETHVLVDVKAEEKGTLVEVGEVLCWIGGACQTSLSSTQGQLDCVTPRIVFGYKSASFLQLNVNYFVTQSNATAGIEVQDGSCWHKIFHNPAVTVGYPIPVRTHEEPGFEISIEAMAILGCARRMTIFDASLLLKGLCSMFVPVLLVGTSVIWHYLMNEDLSWMSYNEYHRVEGRPPDKLPTGLSQVMECRQFVGWTKAAKIKAGQYFIHFSKGMGFWSEK